MKSSTFKTHQPAYSEATDCAPGTVVRARVRKARGNTGNREVRVNVSQRSSAAIERRADPSTVLAADRTLFAAEQTFAAWIRTGIAALVGGLAAEVLLTGAMPDWFTGFAATSLILFSALCFAAALWRGARQPARVRRSETRSLPRRLLLGISAGLIGIDVAAVIGIWVTQIGIVS